LAAGLSLAVAAAEPPRIEVNNELLQGLWDVDHGDIAVFKGVPFAAPPIGDLRWRAPRAHVPRPGLQEASKFAPACMQGNHMTRWYAGVARDFGADPQGVGKFNGVSEDCLYLNVWTPDLNPATRLPVMVWVHGGSNAGGWSYEPNYLGDRLAAKGVVVVSISYRLGPFGFFSHPALDNGSGEPLANFGWLDMEYALRWVREHIAAFGGDPDNITVMGESSGAGNIGDFIVHEIAEAGLYRRVIAQSLPASLSQRRTLAEEQQFGLQLTRFMGLSDEEMTAAQLRRIPAEEIARAMNEALPGHYYDVVEDGLTMVRRPLDSYDSAAIAQVDLLVGTNKNEWSIYLDEASTWEDVDAWLQDNAPAGAAILRMLVADEADPRVALDRLETAHQMMCPARYMSARISAAGGRAWVYYFSRQRPGPGGEKLGVYHGTEIGYVFDQHEYWQTTDAWDRELTQTVMDYWVQFARTGDPNLPGRPHWPKYTAAVPQVLELGDTVERIPPPDADLCLWLSPSRGAAR
jgi:para-nitrobenzyl esterase